jgi:hypothetical protein
LKQPDWQESSDPVKMLELLEKRSIRARLLRLFGAACCRRAWLDLTDARSRDAIAALERFADSPGKQPDQAELKAAYEAAEAAVEQAIPNSRAWFAARVVDAAAEPTLAWWTARWSADLWLTAVGRADKDAGDRVGPGFRKREKAAVAGLLRDVIPNPFRPVTVDRAFITPVIQALAQAAYDERTLPSGELDPVRLSVLADALEEAGAGGEVVEHLRSKGPHVRGCFVIDALTGRA